ncbi:sensor histidine kinase [Butyrivibrio sp. VCD2006]|uniref:sensor histidine kinase n=1 Tax=Butyrivibrio sp. VCD2006 TaxID=1280664 RepID=UPI0018CB3C6B|nr:GHKL domain-containing protein [Butyrivibrio sp. VCD2006]
MNIDAISKKVLLFISLLFISCAFLIYEVLITYGSNIQSSHYVPLITLIVLFFLLTTISAVSILIITKKNYENQQQLNNLRTLQEYTDNLEATYNSLRSFKHDYINILSSISLYIDDKRYDELADFFHDKIMPMKDELTHKNAALANLSRVKNLEIKSILYTKFLMAINQNIDVTIDIADEIGTLKIDSIDLTRILGIYLDNAIEAAVETEHPEVCFHLGVTNNSTVFIISNSYVDHGLSISQMSQKDVSSKGSDHGLGLYNVSKILSKYDNIFTDTSTHEGSFIQQLQIV